jgi:RNA polymerase sigma factor (sigma-70 family)
MDEHIEALARGAKQGNKRDLEELIAGIQSPIFDLSLRMLMFVADAEDATQEILIKIITHLSDFKGESRFSTWLYRIAVNHLLSLKRYRAKEMNITFDFWEADMKRSDPDFDYEALPEPTKTLLTEEVRIGCMQGMLQCLETKLRIAFILGNLFEISGKEAADILGITAEAHRQRLSRARAKITAFMQKNCRLVNPDNPCHCSNLVGPDIRDKWVDPDNPQFVGVRCHAKIDQTVKDRLLELNEIVRVMVLFRSYPEYSAPDAVVEIVKRLMDSRQYEILQHG